MNPIDKLEALLTDAGIPFERIKEAYSDEYDAFNEMFGEAGKWRRNQIVYGAAAHPAIGKVVDWQLDAIWQAGSYGLPDMVECWGRLIGANPKPMLPEEAFEIIKRHWEEQNEREI